MPLFHEHLHFKLRNITLLSADLFLKLFDFFTVLLGGRGFAFGRLETLSESAEEAVGAVDGA
jgi:hypothetical protein